MPVTVPAQRPANLESDMGKTGLDEMYGNITVTICFVTNGDKTINSDVWLNRRVVLVTASKALIKLA